MSFREFDDVVTAPIHGFDGAADYYERSSSARVLSNIKVQTFLIQAADDPFLPASAIPDSESLNGANDTGYGIRGKPAMEVIRRAFAEIRRPAS